MARILRVEEAAQLPGVVEPVPSGVGRAEDCSRQGVAGAVPQERVRRREKVLPMRAAGRFRRATSRRRGEEAPDCSSAAEVVVAPLQMVPEEVELSRPPEEVVVPRRLDWGEERRWRQLAAER